MGHDTLNEEQFADHRIHYTHVADERGGAVTAWQGDKRIGDLDHAADGFVEHVHVHPDYRRQGIATGMLSHMQAQGYTPGFDTEGNTSAGTAWIHSVVQRDRRGE